MGLAPSWAATTPTNQGTKAWLEWRKLGIGSSEAPIIMGVSEFSTPYELWVKRVRGGDEDESNWAMEKGKELESEARRAYEQQFNVRMLPATLEHPEYPFIRASFDGLSEDRSKVLEIKFSGKDDHQLAKLGEVPKKYFPQLQHLMFVSGAKECDYWSYFGNDEKGYDGIRVIVKRDDAYIAEMFKKECEFWECLQTKTQPPFTEQDYVPIENETILALIEQWKHFMEQAEKFTEAANEIKAHITGACTHPNMVGSGVRISLITKVGAVDYSKIPDIQGVDVEKYRKPSTTYYTLRREKNKERG